MRKLIYNAELKVIGYNENGTVTMVEGYIERDEDIKITDITEAMSKLEAENERSAALALIESRKMSTDYNGTSVSLTSADALALMQIKTAFEMGETRTVFKFKNGEEMDLTPTIFAEFAPWFVQKRNEFFQ